MEHKKLMLNRRLRGKAMDNSLWTFFISRMQDLQYTLGTFMLKEQILFGPVTSMQNILKKGIKKEVSVGSKGRTKPYQPKDSIEQE